MKKSLLIAFIAMSLVLFTSVGVAFAGKPGGGGGDGVTMQQVNGAIDAAKAEMRAYTDGAVSVIQYQISDLYTRVGNFGTDIAMLWNETGNLWGETSFIWEKIGYLDQYAQSLDSNNQDLFGQLGEVDMAVKSAQNDIGVLSGMVGGINSLINNLDQRVAGTEHTLQQFQIPPQEHLVTGDLALKTPQTITLVNGHEVNIDDFGLTLPGQPTKKVDADLWFYADLSAFEPGWHITLIPEANQWNMSHSLKTDIPSGSSFTLHAYAFYAGNYWTAPITVTQP